MARYHSPYDDDASISDDTIVWRRIPFNHYVPEETRISSGAFSDSSDSTPMSITIVDENVDLSKYAEIWPGEAIVRLQVGRIREIRGGNPNDMLGVTRDPNPPKSDPNHGFVNGKKTGGIQNQLVAISEWVLRPEEVIPPWTLP